MKDSEFIELLNLYLDHEISAADAVRLETEVQGNAARRHIYEQYCRMQKACKVLAEDFQTEPATADRKVVAFEPVEEQTSPAKRASGFYTFGTLAAVAACVAIVLVSRTGDQPATSAAGALAQTTPATVQQVAATSLVKATPSQTATTSREFLGGAPLTLSGKAQSDALQVAATEETNARFAWMASVQLQPIQMQPVTNDSLRFDQRPAQIKPAVYSSPEPLQTDVHMSAFRFQR